MRVPASLLAVVTFFTFASAAAQGVADEERDDGVTAQAELRLEEYSSATPLQIPGAARISTAALRGLIAAAQADPDAVPLLFDVLGGPQHDSLPGAIWLPGAGRGRSFDDPVQAQLARVLDLTGRGSRNRALVFFCASKTCWLSYNAALRAVRLGHAQGYWYRGGIEAWQAAGLALAPLRVSWRRPEGE